MKQRYGIGALWVLAMLLGLPGWLSQGWWSTVNWAILPDGTTATQRLLLTKAKLGQAGRTHFSPLRVEIPTSSRTPATLCVSTFRPPATLYLSSAYGTTCWSASTGYISIDGGISSVRSGRHESFSEANGFAARHGTTARISVATCASHQTDVTRRSYREALAILAAVSPAETPAAHRGAWMSRDRSKALLVAETRAHWVRCRCSSQGPATGARLVRSLVGASPFRLPHGVDPVYLRSRSSAPLKGEAWWLSMTAATLVLVFLYASYRSVTLVLLSAIPLTSGILIGMLAVQGWFGFYSWHHVGFRDRAPRRGGRLSDPLVQPSDRSRFGWRGHSSDLADDAAGRADDDHRICLAAAGRVSRTHPARSVCRRGSHDGSGSHPLDSPFVRPRGFCSEVCLGGGYASTLQRASRMKPSCRLPFSLPAPRCCGLIRLYGKRIWRSSALSRRGKNSSIMNCGRS